MSKVILNEDREMSQYFTDTRPEAEAVLIKLMRQTPPWRKLQMVVQLNHTMHTLQMSGLRQRHPQASEKELRRRMADLLLGPELALKVYGVLEPTGEPPAKAEFEHAN